MCLLLLAVIGGCAEGGTPIESPPVVEITWLANEGVLIAAGDRRVLIDAFVSEPYSMYTHLSESVAQDVLAGVAPFAGVDLALASHVHRDHFQPEFAQAYFDVHRDTPLLSSRQVVELVGPKENAEVRYPQPGQSSHWSGAGITVEFLNLSHGGGRFAGIHNLGHIIEIDGVRILHIGDAAMQPRNFEPYRLAERDLDVALIPYWYFSSEDGGRIVDEHLVADLRIAVHLPRAGADTENVEVARRDERVEVPAQQMQRWVIVSDRSVDE